MPITTGYTACSVNDTPKLGMRHPWRWFHCRGKPLTVGRTACNVIGV